MMKKIFMYIISVLLLTGCNITLFVSKDDVIRKKQGYLVVGESNKYVDFITSKIDTSLSLSDNLIKHKLGKAFYLNGLFPKQLNYIKIFGDTISNSWIVIPVEIKYFETREVNRQLRKQEKKYHEHFIKVNDKIYIYQINVRNIHYISAWPLLSEKKRREKASPYEEQQ